LPNVLRTGRLKSSIQYNTNDNPENEQQNNNSIHQSAIRKEVQQYYNGRPQKPNAESQESFTYLHAIILQ
jgi:hypothetical protein